MAMSGHFVLLLLALLRAAVTTGDGDVRGGLCFASEDGQRKEVCCAGWETIDEQEAAKGAGAKGEWAKGEWAVGEGLRCRPRCEPPCVDASCVAPDVCACRKGYAHVPGVPNRCEPHCAMPCINATCQGPDKCVCKEGFRPRNKNVCVPHCSGCVGRCVAPGECVSLPPGFDGGTRRIVGCASGYHRRPGASGRCEPVCVGGCVNGQCVAPDRCRCNAGYAPSSTKAGAGRAACVPQCVGGCVADATCVAPDECRCRTGYALSSGACVPQCVGGCVANATCVAPDLCECLPGFARTPTSDEEEDDRCVPQCVPACGEHAFCASPGKCACRDGYRESGKARGSCEAVCEPSCQEGGGLCLEPAVCSCAPPLVWDETSARCQRSTTAPPTTTTATTTTTTTDGAGACSERCVHGSCQSSGLCVCLDGWLGADCSVEDRRGCRRCGSATERCDNVTSECVCKRGWTADDCSQQCPLKPGSPTFDLSVCPLLADCECKHKDPLKFCPSESAIVCLRDKAETSHQKQSRWFSDELWWVPWAIGVGAVCLVSVIVIIVIVRRCRKTTDEHLQEEDTCSKDSPQMSGIDLADWRFIPISQTTE